MASSSMLNLTHMKYHTYMDNLTHTGYDTYMVKLTHIYNTDIATCGAFSTY